MPVASHAQPDPLEKWLACCAFKPEDMDQFPAGRGTFYSMLLLSTFEYFDAK